MIHGFTMLSYQLNGFGVAALHHRTHLLVDLLGNRIGHVTAGHQIAAQEHLLSTTLKCNRTKIRHTKTRHHLAGHRGHLLNIAASTCGHFFVAEDHVFSSTATKGTHDSRFQLSARHQHLLFVRREPGQTLRLSPGDQRHFLHGVMGFDKGAHEGMTHFVISNQTLAASIGEGLTLHARDDAINRIVDFAEADGVFTTAGREDGRFVQQVGQIRTSESGGPTGNALQSEIAVELFVAGMHLKDRQTPLDVGSVNGDLTIETTRTHQRGVEHIWAVCGGENDDAAVALEAIHLREELVQGLLALVVTTTDTGATLATNGINFVDEDQAGAVLLGALKQIAHATCTHTNEHLHKFRAREGEERNTSFTSNGFREQGLTGSGRANEQDTFGNAGTNGRETFRLLEEGDHFLKVLLGF